MAQSCFSLAGSTACPAFSSASVSTDPDVTGFFDFVQNVHNVKSFDSQLKEFVSNGYVQQKYIDLFGCGGINLGQTQDLYAQYTTSFICNALVQSSRKPCGVQRSDAPPLCADSCASFALSEQRIVASPSLCRAPSGDVFTQLRADLTNCGLPKKAISSTCVEGYQNEPENCGFQSNLQGLCSFCRSSTVNATDSCCVTSNAESRCKNVDLPVFTSMKPVTTTSSSSTSSSSSSTTSAPAGAGAGNGQIMSNGLTGGQIAGVVIGSVLGALLILGLLICCCIFIRRRQQRQSSTLNQPTPPRSGEATSQPRPPPFEALPGARVTRMTALEAEEQDASTENGVSGDSSGGFDTSPESQGTGAGTAAAIAAGKKGDGTDESSPESGDYSSPDNGAAQSERMSSFKDYYSAEEIHAGDLVSTLWAYQPRAPDEFELERGDMLKVVGIWDDGWATGVRISTRAGDWSPSQRSGRDSVVSNDSARADSSGDGEIKAFPLVCVCLPQYWRATIEGEPSSPPEMD